MPRSTQVCHQCREIADGDDALRADLGRQGDRAAIRHEPPVPLQVDHERVQFGRLEKRERGRAQLLVSDAVQGEVERFRAEGLQPHCLRPAYEAPGPARPRVRIHGRGRGQHRHRPHRARRGHADRIGVPCHRSSRSRPQQASDVTASTTRPLTRRAGSLVVPAYQPREQRQEQQAQLPAAGSSVLPGQHRREVAS